VHKFRPSFPTTEIGTLVVYVRVKLLEVLVNSKALFPLKELEFCTTWGSHGGEYEDGRLLRCSAVWTGMSVPTFQSLVLPVSAGP
jgi:hypothetical protein